MASVLVAATLRTEEASNSGTTPQWEAQGDFP